MPGRECYHCKAWVEESAPHDCWTTTEENLTCDLPEQLGDAWERLRDTASAFGEQRIYASHHSIMFSRSNCYFFVRPQPKYLEICFFLGRAVKHPLVRSARRTSAVKVGHILRVTHRDEVEAPITDWLKEAYDMAEKLKKTGPGTKRAAPARKGKKKKSKAVAKEPKRKIKTSARKKRK